MVVYGTLRGLNVTFMYQAHSDIVETLPWWRPSVDRSVMTLSRLFDGWPAALRDPALLCAAVVWLMLWVSARRRWSAVKWYAASSACLTADVTYWRYPSNCCLWRPTASHDSTHNVSITHIRTYADCTAERLDYLSSDDRSQLNRVERAFSAEFSVGATYYYCDWTKLSYIYRVEWTRSVQAWTSLAKRGLQIIQIIAIFNSQRTHK